MIQINKNNPTSSSNVDKIEINSLGKGWVIDLPKPTAGKAITKIKLGFYWTAYSWHVVSSTEKQGPGAILYPCPCTSDGVNYQKIKEAGGEDRTKSKYINPIGSQTENMPCTVEIELNPAVDYDFMQMCVKNGCILIMGDTLFSDATATISSVYAQYSYTDAMPYVTNISPSSGVIDEKSDNKFTWDIAFSGIVGNDLKQGGAKFEWKRKGEDDSKITEINLSGEQKSYTLPSNSLKDGDILLYRLTLKSNMGITGETCPWVELSTQETEPSKCRCISPMNIYVDGSLPVTFRWEHISAIGGKSSGYDVQFKRSGQWVTVATDTKSEAKTCEIPVTELSAGLNFWRARTYNSDGVVGYWAEAASFYVVAAPDVPVFSSVERGKPRPLVTWSSVGQTGWQLQAVQAGKVVYDSGMTAGTITQTRVSDYLEDGTYNFRLRIQNEFNKLSEWAEYAHTITTVKPDAPTFVGMSVPDMGIELMLTSELKPGEVAKVKRDGKIIGDISGEFWDYSALGTCVYSVIVIDPNDCFAESTKLTLTYLIKDVQLSLASDLSQTVHLILQTGFNQAIRSATRSYDSSENYFAGRKFPCVDFSEHIGSGVSLKYAYSSAEDFEKLLELCDKRETLLYRDSKGERFYCAITSISDEKFALYTTFTMSLSKVDYAEVTV